jgi:chromosome segregation ATPase
MAKNAANESQGRKRQWFARRQVYLRAGQDSQYVELSPLLQIGTAIGFGMLALWLIGASYTAVTGYLGGNAGADMSAELNAVKQTLLDVERERDDALATAAKLGELELALANAEQAAVEAQSSNQTAELTVELEQTQAQLEDLQLRLSESRADHAALQARFEAETIGEDADTTEKTAEEASSLHAQLEEAFAEIEALQQQRNESSAELNGLRERERLQTKETERHQALLKAAQAEIERLQDSVDAAEAFAAKETEGFKQVIDALEQERDTASAELVALRERDQASSAVAERNQALLKAAQAEIERLQDSVETAKADAANETGSYEETISALRAELADISASKTALEQTVEQLNSDLEQASLVSQSETTRDAEGHAQFIQAGLKEAELLATIDSLRAEIESGGSDASEDDALVDELKKRVTIAESEVERLIFSRLREAENSIGVSLEGNTETTGSGSGDAAETELLRSQLLAAQANIIKLNADVKAAKKRLADQADEGRGQTAGPDNSAKLEQQLASTRSQVHQLNKALANAKLREVAIDLALINVLPAPSPPAPR